MHTLEPSNNPKRIVSFLALPIVVMFCSVLYILDKGWLFYLFPIVIAFLIPLAYFFLNLLSLFSPKVILRISNPNVVLGQKIYVSATVGESQKTISPLRLTLECISIYTNRELLSGQDVTRRERIYENTIFCEPYVPAVIEGDFSIPMSCYPTFSSKTEVLWRLRLAGEIKNWPNINLTYPIIVKRPHPNNNSWLSEIS